VCVIQSCKCNSFVGCWLEHHLIHVFIYIYIYVIYIHLLLFWRHGVIVTCTMICTNCYTVFNISWRARHVSLNIPFFKKTSWIIVEIILKTICCDLLYSFILCSVLLLWQWYECSLDVFGFERNTDCNVAIYTDQNIYIYTYV
jgi:hypothetical protein